MDAPVCRICGKKHWSRLCAGEVTDPVTQAVTKPVTVTPSVTCQSCLTLTAEMMRLTAEVAMLKRKLSEANGGKAIAKTATERMKAMRERRKHSPS